MISSSVKNSLSSLLSYQLFNFSWKSFSSFSKSSHFRFTKISRYKFSNIDFVFRRRQIFFFLRWRFLQISFVINFSFLQFWHRQKKFFSFLSKSKSFLSSAKIKFFHNRKRKNRYLYWRVYRNRLRKIENYCIFLVWILFHFRFFLLRFWFQFSFCFFDHFSFSIIL